MITTRASGNPNCDWEDYTDSDSTSTDSKLHKRLSLAVVGEDSFIRLGLFRTTEVLEVIVLVDMAVPHLVEYSDSVTESFQGLLAATSALLDVPSFGKKMFEQLWFVELCNALALYHVFGSIYHEVHDAFGNSVNHILLHDAIVACNQRFHDCYLDPLAVGNLLRRIHGDGDLWQPDSDSAGMRSG